MIGKLLHVICNNLSFSQIPDKHIFEANLSCAFCLIGGQSNSALPPPPWEAQLDESLPPTNHPQQMQVNQGVLALPQPSPSGPYLPPPANDQVVGVYNGGHLTAINTPAMQSNQMPGVHPYPMQSPNPNVMYPQPMQSGQMGYMYPQQMYNNNQMAGYGYGYSYPQNQQQNAYFAQQTISALSVRDDSGLRNSTSSNLASARPPKPEDKLFGDLVDMSKFKSGKSTPGRAGSM